MKSIYNKLLVLIILIPLGYLMMDLLDIILKSGTIELFYPNYDYKLIFIIAYGLSLLITLILIPNLTRIGMIYLIMFSFLCFGLNIFGAKSLSNYSISPMIKNTVSLSFNLYFSFSLYLLIVLCLIEVLRKIGFKTIFEKIPTLDLNINLRFSRLLAYLIDLILALSIYWVLSLFRIINSFPLSILFILLAYRVILETLYHQTIGKRIINNLTIVKKDFISLEFEHIIVRNFSRLIFFYMIPILWNGQGLHDIISKTKILKNAH
jgi:hypothetical protein